MQALARFQEVDSVSGTVESGVGLGPIFNGNSCAMCHAQPAAGGSSPGLSSPQNAVPNPQVALAKLDGATNTVPSFITATGPVREARFVATDPTNVYSALDGGVARSVHDSGAHGRTRLHIGAAKLRLSAVVWQRHLPDSHAAVWTCLVESTPDATLQANLTSTSCVRSKLGIGGSFNTSGNDGTITRFGWKAQNKSLLIFVSEAYNVEQGVTNEGFPNERNTTAGCVFNATPEDSSNILNPNQSSPNVGMTVGTVSEMSSDVVNFALFIRLSAPPNPAPPNSSITNGQSLFSQIGCNLCHSPHSRRVAIYRDVQSDLSPVLRLRPASHGRRAG